jgi:hypothetical protein
MAPSQNTKLAHAVQAAFAVPIEIHDGFRKRGSMPRWWNGDAVIDGLGALLKAHAGKTHAPPKKKRTGAPGAAAHHRSFTWREIRIFAARID